MAGNQTQFKLNQLAKDMGLKAKDLTDVLTAGGAEDVKSQKSLSEQEFNLLMQALTTTHQIANIGDYMSGATRIPTPRAIEAEKAAAEKAAAEKAAAQKAAAEKAAAEKAAAQKAAAEKAAAEKAAAEKAAAEKAAAEKAAAEKAAAEKAAAEKAAAEKAAAEKVAAEKAAAQKRNAGATVTQQTPQRPAASSVAGANGYRNDGQRAAQGGQSQGQSQGQRPAQRQEGQNNRPFSDRPRDGQRMGAGAGQAPFGAGLPCPYP